MIDWFTGRQVGWIEEDVLLADVVQDLHEDVLVGEREDLRLAEGHAEVAADLARRGPGWRSRCRRRTSRSTRAPPPRRTPSCERRIAPGARPRLGAVIVAHASPLRQPFAEGGDADHPIALVEAHRDDAARTRRVAVDRVRLRPHDLAGGADEEQLIVGLGHLLDGGDTPRLAPLERDEHHALPATVLAPELGQRDTLAVARLGQDQEVPVGLHDAHGDDLVPGARQADPDDPRCVAAHRPDLRLGEAGELAQRRGDDHVVVARGDVDPGQLVVLREGDRPDPGGPDLLELLERRLLDDPPPGRHDQELAGLEVRDHERRGRDLAGLDLDAGQVDDRDPLGLPAGIDDRVDLRAEDAAAVREEQRPVVGVGHQQAVDRVLLAGHVADDPLPAAALAPVGGHRLALDVAAPADRHDDVLVGDEVLVRHLAARVVDDPRPPLAGVLALELEELLLDDPEDPGRVGQDVLELGDELDDGEVLVLDLLALEGGQAGEAHVQDRLGLDLGQPEAAR